MAGEARVARANEDQLRSSEQMEGGDFEIRSLFSWSVWPLVISGLTKFEAALQNPIYLRACTVKIACSPSLRLAYLSFNLVVGVWNTEQQPNQGGVNDQHIRQGVLRCVLLR